MTIFDLTNKQCRELIFEDLDTEQFKIMEDIITGHDRWSVFHSLVIKDTYSDKFYETEYRVGATENQDERPFEHTDPNWVELVSTVWVQTRLN
jgi:hypothetical protein